MTAAVMPERTHVDVAELDALLESLVEQGLLCTEDSDWGLCYYRITDSGIERSKTLDEECDRMREACFSKLSDEELAQLTELLDKLIR